MSGLEENQTVNDNRILGYLVNGRPSAAKPVLQFNETTKSFDWVVISSGSMGDLEFIESKVIAGDYFQVSGDINILNDTIEFVVPNGKTAFLIEAKIIIKGHVTPASAFNVGDGVSTVKNEIEAALKIDGVVKDETNLGFDSFSRSKASSSTYSNSNAYGILSDGRFGVLGLSLVGDNTKKVEIENILDNGSAFATMSGYLIDT